VLAGISPPADSELPDASSSGGVLYQRYSTSDSPSNVESDYKQRLDSAGWSIVNSGGSAGGWGPYGGSDYGLTAKRSDDHVDLQASSGGVGVLAGVVADVRPAVAVVVVAVAWLVVGEI
jgi:hypothetical protein